MMTGFGFMGAWGWLMMVSMALFWVAIILLVVWAFSRVVLNQTPSIQSNALEILKQRFARGEISQAEYEQAKHALV